MKNTVCKQFTNIRINLNINTEILVRIKFGSTPVLYSSYNT